jgi:hypothetical protein
VAGRELIGWTLLALIALMAVTTGWLAATHQRRRLRRERRDETRFEERLAARVMVRHDKP